MENIHRFPRNEIGKTFAVVVGLNLDTPSSSIDLWRFSASDALISDAIYAQLKNRLALKLYCVIFRIEIEEPFYRYLQGYE